MDNTVGRKYKSIEFTKFVFYQDDTGFECTVKADDHKNPDIIYFKFNKPIGKISNNLVFGALMTLVGKEWYENAFIDLSVSQWTYEKATKVTTTNIHVRDFDYQEDVDKRSSYNGNVLSLSGGIDSNSTFYMLERGAIPFHVIGTDFGSAYARDFEVFKDRSDLIMATNIRNNDTKYVADKKTWTFMGISCILSIDYFKTKHIIFGQVNQYDRYQRTISGDKGKSVRIPGNSFFSIVDCETHGIQFLTEFQNAIVLLDNIHDEKLLQKISDASATTGHLTKFFRKQIFLLAAMKFLGKGKVDYSKYKFINPKDKFHKKFVEEVNSMTEKDKNLVLILGLKYLGCSSTEFNNQLFNKVNDFSFITDVYSQDLPEFYARHPKLMEYLSTIFNFR